MGITIIQPTLLSTGPRRWRTGFRYTAGQGGLTTTLATQGQVRAHPIWVPPGAAITALGYEITTSGEANSIIRLGIFAPDEYDMPANATPVAEVTAAGSQAAGYYEASLSYTFAYPGWWWLGFVAQDCATTPPTMRCLNGPMPWQFRTGTFSTNQQALGVSGVSNATTGAYPAWGSSVSVASSGVPRIMAVAA